MTELCCEYLSVRCIWLPVIIMSRTSLRVNPHSIVCLNAKELLARSRCHIWRLSGSKVASLAKWLSVRLQTKWLWDWIRLLSLKISKFYIVSLTFSKNLRNLDSFDIYTKILQEITYNQFEMRVNITLSLRQVLDLITASW